MKTSFIFSISEKKHKKELEILSKIPNNMRNAFLKELVRVYMGNIFLSLYTGQDITICTANKGTVPEIANKQETAEKPVVIQPEQHKNELKVADDMPVSVPVVKISAPVVEEQPEKSVKPEPENIQEQENSLGDLFASLTFE